MVDLYLQSPIQLHGLALNYLSKGTTLPFILPTSSKGYSGLHNDGTSVPENLIINSVNETMYELEKNA
jgi:hypothetical protein